MITQKEWTSIRNAYLKGNQAPFRVAFIQLKKKLLPSLRMKLNIKSKEVLEDAYADAVLSFAQKYIIGQQELPRSVEAYIRTSAHRKIIDLWRKNNNTRAIQLEELDTAKVQNTIKMMFSSSVDTEDYYEQEESEHHRLVILQKAIQRLCDKCKALIEEHLFERKTLKRLKEDLNYTSYQSIVDKKQSCMKKLRKLFYKELCNV